MTKGIIQALSAFLFYSGADALLRYGHGAIPTYQMAFFGGLIAFITVPFLLRRGDSLVDLVRPHSWVVWLFRGLLCISGTLLGVFCFGHLPLAEAMSLSFMTPLLTTVLAAVFLKEQVRLKVWIGTGIGLVGVFVILTPHFHQFSLGHMAAIGAGLSGSAAAVLTRHTKDSEKPVTMFGAATLSLLAFSGLMMISTYQPMTLSDWGIVIGVGVLGAAGGLFMLLAWRNAPAASIASAQYTQLIWGLLIGWLVFQETLRASTMLGLCMILATVAFLSTRKPAPIIPAEGVT